MDFMYWANVETRPGQGYPRRWDRVGGGFEEGELTPSEMPTLEDYGHAYVFDHDRRLFRGAQGGPAGPPGPAGEKPVMPHVAPYNGPNWDEDIGARNGEDPYYFYLPRICNHCTHPACLEACPRKAIYKREEDGIVLIDQQRCEGYRYCVKACPYKKIFFNEVLGKAQKCILCYPRMEQGEVPACMRQCPGRLRFVGLLDDPESPVHQIVVKHRAALGLFPERGTQPNVYYVPPFNPPRRGSTGKSILEDPRLPLDYLKYLFGPEVEDVIRRLEAELVRAQAGERSELLQLLIGRDERARFRIVPHEELIQLEAGAPSRPSHYVQPLVQLTVPGPKPVDENRH
jgi:DMSO reductase family type II enzyme iron-sulfur subunit